MSLGCFERALKLAGDEAMADIWYNVSHVAMALGDVSMAYQVKAFGYLHCYFIMQFVY